MHASDAITIDVHALRDRLAQGEPTLVLDVRPKAEHAEWRIPGSQSLDVSRDPQDDHAPVLDTWTAPPGRLVVTVCAAGKTSLQAALQLRSRGIEARSLEGGMAAWSLAWNTANVPLPDGGAASIVQVRRVGKGCLSYVIGSRGEAAVVDPSLEPAVYESLASARDWVIRHVLDTHIHADHLSRGRLLAERNGATLHLPEQERASFPASPVRDGDRIRVGTTVIGALHVPGHTMESTAYLVDEAALLSGDTLFLRSVGRPDLHGDRHEQENYAQRLRDSLRRLLSLPATVIVLPGHSDEPLGFDGRAFAAPLGVVHDETDWLHLSEGEFVEAIGRRIPPAPENYQLIVRLNEQGLFPGGQAAALEQGTNRCALTGHS